MNTTVPSSRPGFKSLPAELKVGGNNPWVRMRAQAPGYAGVRPGRRIRLAGLGAGLGDCTDLSDPSCYTGGAVDWSTLEPAQTTPDWTSTADQLNQLTVPPAGYAGPLTLPANQTSKPAPPTGYDWAKVLNATGQTMGQILAISQGGGTVQLANGTRIVHGTAAGDVTGAGAQALGTPLTGVSISTIAIFGGIGLLLFMVMQQRGR